MLRAHLAQTVRATVDALVAQGRLPDAVAEVPVEIADTKEPGHGDFACNFALVAARQAKTNPRQIAELLSQTLLESEDHPFESVDVAGPGFINVRLRAAFIENYLQKVLDAGPDLPRTSKTHPRSLNVEFVSVNPNGPITVGSGRGAAFGDTLCRVLEAAGDHPAREYYINDGMNSEQMRLFADSVRFYLAEARGEPAEFPEKGYRGDYVKEIAKAIADREGDVRDLAQAMMIERQRRDLDRFGVQFQRWFSEQSLHDSGKVQQALAKLEANGTADREPYRCEIPRESTTREFVRTDEEPGPLWLRASRFGDDSDRVLTRTDGRPAYIAADVAYLEDKLGGRGFDKAIIILGPDHHGYIARMNAVCQALGYPPERLEIVIYQVVRFVKEGKPAPMRKRDGNIYELADLVRELGSNIAPDADLDEQMRIGRDVARFFYLMRSHETHMDFDIDLATKQSDENPVFYVQYAHARICSVLTKGREAGLGAQTPHDPGLLVHPRELALIKRITDLPDEVERCARDYGVHRLTSYAIELARSYHHFYDACRVVQPDQPQLSQARMALCRAAAIGLKATLDLLGVSAPERM